MYVVIYRREEAEEQMGCPATRFSVPVVFCLSGSIARVFCVCSFTDEKKRKSKWDALPPGLPSQPQRSGSGTAPNLTTSATGTRATIISAVGTLTKKNTFNIINTTGPTKWCWCVCGEMHVWKWVCGDSCRQMSLCGGVLEPSARKNSFNITVCDWTIRVMLMRVFANKSVGMCVCVIGSAWKLVRNLTKKTSFNNISMTRPSKWLMLMHVCDYDRLCGCGSEMSARGTIFHNVSMTRPSEQCMCEHACVHMCVRMNNCATIISFLTKKNTFNIISVAGLSKWSWCLWASLWEMSVSNCAIRTLQKKRTPSASSIQFNHQSDAGACVWLS